MNANMRIRYRFSMLSAMHLAAGLMLINVAGGQAGTLHWDPYSQLPSGTGGGAQNWGAAGTKWYDYATSSHVGWSDNNTAYFGGTAAATTLSENPIVTGLIFATGGYSLAEWPGRLSQLIQTSGEDAVNVTAATGTTTTAERIYFRLIDAGTITNASSGLLTIGGFVNNNGYPLTVAGAGDTTMSDLGYVAGAGSVTKQGDGTLVLNGNNTFTGGLEIVEGAVQVSTITAKSTAQPLGQGDVLLSGGTLVFSTSAGTGLQLNGNQNITLAGGTTSTLDLRNAGSNSESDGGFRTTGSLTGAGNLVVEASGSNALVRVLFGGTNDFTGMLTVGGGVFQAASKAAGDTTLGNNAPIVVNGGILRVGSGLGGTGDYTVAIGSLAGTGGYVESADGVAGGITTLSVGGLNTSTVYAGSIRNNNGSGSRVTALTKVGDGALTLTGNNTFTGGLNIAEGAVEVSTIAAKSTAQPLGRGDVILSGGTLLFATDGTTGIQLGGNQDITLTSGTTSTLDLRDAGSNNHSLGGFRTAGTLTGAGNLIVNASGSNASVRVIFGGTNDFTGTLTVNGGVFQAAYNNATGNTTLGDNAATVVNGGTLRIGNSLGGSGDYSVAIGSLAGAGGQVESADGVAGGITTLNIGGLDTSTVYAGSIRNNNGSGSRVTALTKVGDGMLTVTGNNTFTGETTISEGVLAVGGTGSINSSSAIKIAGGADYGAQYQVTFSTDNLASIRSQLISGDSTAVQLPAAVLAGTESAIGSTITMEWRLRNDDEMDRGALASDVLSLTSSLGTSDLPLYVLAMQYDDSLLTVAESEVLLGWYNTDAAAWVNAIAGNIGNNAAGDQRGYQGSFTAFQGEFGPTLTDYVGAYGVDTANQHVWAVLNHASEFAAIVPEPSTLALLAGAMCGLLACTPRRRRQ